jgi:hypothetical protein
MEVEVEGGEEVGMLHRFVIHGYLFYIFSCFEIFSLFFLFLSSK